jgi:hypothetical protein
MARHRLDRPSTGCVARVARVAAAGLALLALGSLAACSSSGGPLVAPGTRVVADPAVRWVAQIAWSDDGDEVAFLGTPIGGALEPYRASLTDASLLGDRVGGFEGTSQIRYLPGGRDLIVVGRLTAPPAEACASEGVVVVRDAAAVAVVGCPYEAPHGVVGRANNADVEPDQFVAVHPAGSAVVVPSGTGAQWVDLSTTASRSLGPGYPVTFDPTGEQVVVVEVGLSDWDAQVWSVVAVADGERTPLPVDTARFERGYHVLGVRWLADGLWLLVEHDLAEGSEWRLWNLDTGEERVLGEARASVGAFPLGNVPRWSASGRLLAFREYECLRPSIFIGCAVPRWSVVVFDLDAGDRQLVYRGEGFVDAPVIAPDDGAVAFAVQGVIYRKELR